MTREAKLEAVLREWLEADRELREHPPNDTTKRWEDKMRRVELARQAAEQLLKGTT